MNRLALIAGLIIAWPFVMAAAALAMLVPLPLLIAKVWKDY